MSDPKPDSVPKGSELDTHHQPHRDHVTRMGKKRLFSNRTSTQLANHETLEDSDNLDRTSVGDEDQSGKRRRSADWPLKLTVDDEPWSQTPLRSRSITSKSPTFRRTNSSLSRPSRFIEGSMNDRVSRKPPPVYFGVDQEDLLERLDADQSDRTEHRKSNHSSSYYSSRSTAPSSVDEKSDANRQSGIFRFGRSLAASFNPNNWKIWAKTPQPQETVQEKLLRERREKAESVYRELKASGQFRASSHIPRNSTRHSEHVNRAHEKHDSAVHFDNAAFSTETARDELLGSRPTSRQEKRYGKVFLEPPVLRSPSEHGRSPAGLETPASEGFSSMQRSSFAFKKPAPSNPNFGQYNIGKHEEVYGGGSETDFRALHKLPSRKDLQKQQQLVKRVSNLEGKLEAARRQLSEALGESFSNGLPPMELKTNGRPRFVPGGLSTLPSEQWLNTHTTSDSDSNSVTVAENIGRAVSTDATDASAMAYTPGKHHVALDSPRTYNLIEKPCPKARSSIEANREAVPVLQLLDRPTSETGLEMTVPHPPADAPSHIPQNPLTKLVPGAQGSRKRKSIDTGAAEDSNAYKPSEGSETSEAEDGEDEIVEPVAKRKPGRPRKAQKADQEYIPLPTGRGSIGRQSTAISASKKVAKTSRIPRKGNHSTSSPTILSKDTERHPGEFDFENALQEPNQDMHVIPADEYIPPVPQLPGAVRLPSGEILEVRNNAAENRNIGPSADAVDKHGMPHCTACNTRFSSRGRLVNHIEKFCKALKAVGVYDENDVEVNTEAASIGGAGSDQMEDTQVRGKQSFEWPADVF